MKNNYEYSQWKIINESIDMILNNNFYLKNTDKDKL